MAELDATSHASIFYPKPQLDNGSEHLAHHRYRRSLGFGGKSDLIGVMRELAEWISGRRDPATAFLPPDSRSPAEPLRSSARWEAAQGC